MLALIGDLSQWQFNWLSNKDTFKLTAIILNNMLFSAMVGLKIRPIAKLNHNRTEGLSRDGKEGRREGKIKMRCNSRGKSKRERMWECMHLYCPLIQR